MLWKRKPKRWIERFDLRFPDDYLPRHLLCEYGFEAYCKEGMVLWEWDRRDENLNVIHSDMAKQLKYGIFKHERRILGNGN